MDVERNLSVNISVRTKRSLASWAGNDRSRFKTLLRYFLEGTPMQVRNASWVLSLVAEEHPEIAIRHLPELIRKCRSHSSAWVRRNVARLLQFVEVPEKYSGEVMDLCYELFTSPKEPIAVRVFSMTVLANLADHYPELRKELKIMLEDQMPYGSPGFVSRARKILARWRDQP
jgi:hypothetical protein